MKKTTLLKFALLLSLCFKVTAQKYDLEDVSAEPFVDAISRTGKLDFKHTFSLSFKSSGYLSKLTVDEGDSFKAKQLLASLDTEELTQIKNSTYAQLIQAKREVNRIQRLIDNNLSSEQQLDNANTLVETTRSQYNVAYYNVQKAQILAPFDGVVLKRDSDLGELQAPGVEALQVAPLKDNWVIKVTLTGTEISQVRIGQKVRVNLHNIGEVSGVVNRIPAIANTDGHLFTIDILLPHLTLQKGIVAGQLAETVIDFTSDNLVYRIPIEALMSVNDQGQALVLVKSLGENKPTQQAFDIFKINNKFVYLLASENDATLRIVTKGWQHISLGNK